MHRYTPLLSSIGKRRREPLEKRHSFSVTKMLKLARLAMSRAEERIDESNYSVAIAEADLCSDAMGAVDAILRLYDSQNVNHRGRDRDEILRVLGGLDTDGIVCRFPTSTPPEGFFVVNTEKLRETLSIQKVGLDEIDVIIQDLSGKL